MAYQGKFKLGDWTVEPHLDRISRGSTRVQLQPQIMELLLYLAQHHRDVVSAEELLQNIWKGRVVTSASVYSSLKLLRKALADDVHDPRYIKTIPRRGYRLVAPIEDLPASTPTHEQHDTPGARILGEKKLHRRIPWLLLAGLIAVAIVALQSRSRVPDQRPAPVPSLAVLPFTDMSPAKNIGWFSDGLAEAILNKLAQVPGLKVAGKVSSFEFREPGFDLNVAGRTLGVFHLLEGSVRRDGDRFLVTTQLRQAADGYSVWSQEYERNASDILEVQDDIVRQVSSTLQPAGADRHEPAGKRAIHPDLSSYELYLQARKLMDQNTKNALVSALEKLQKVLEKNPDFADAHVAIAGVYLDLYSFHGYYTSETAFSDSRRLAELHVDRALEIDPENAAAYVRISEYLVGDDPASLDALETAISLNPNLYEAHLEMGVGKQSYLLPWTEAIEHLDRAVEIEPLSIEAATVLVMFLAFVPYRWEEAETIIENMALCDPESVDVKLIRAQWLLNPLGRPSEAIPILEEILITDPDHYWARSFLAKAWFMVGETERAARMPGGIIHWRYVLAEDREEALRQLREMSPADPKIDFGRRIVSSYAHAMLRNWQGVIDLLEEDAKDLDHFTSTYAENMVLNEAPEISLAVAYRALGMEDKYREFAGLARKAVDIRTDHGKLHNIEFSRSMARLLALEGNHYEAMLELERLIRQGPVDPRELLHPAFDEMRDMPQFKKLVRLQRERINQERENLGLTPLGDSFPRVSSDALAVAPAGN